MKILIVLAVASLAQGFKYSDLRTTYGPSDDKIDKKNFFKIPRSEQEAIANGWTLTVRPPGPLPNLKMYCPLERSVCPLFDKSGFIAGLQIAMRVDDFKSLPNPEATFVRWNAPADGKAPATSYWTATQFFIENDSITRKATDDTVQNPGIWVTNGPDGQLMHIPFAESKIKETPFKKQNCIPNMGTHYYYNFTREADCSESVPTWFLLTSGDQLIGCGFVTTGKVENQSKWFENVPSSITFKSVAPDVPDCLVDRATKYGTTVMHIYYVEEPWTIRCKAGDSL